MTILDKHPAPWAFDEEIHQLEDANGIVIAIELYPPLAPLILAAPELLAALKEAVVLIKREVADRDAVVIPAEALIARIEGSPC